MFRYISAVLLLILSSASATSGQVTAPAPATPADPTRGYDGPAAPVLPATVTRDGQGRTTVRAVRLTEPLRVDGRLDEAIYTLVQPMSDFVQNDPAFGQPATERTDVWISFDADNVYITFRAFESQPDRMIVNEMRRDSNAITQNENVSFMLDTFYDRRNGVLFNINPIGGRMDGQITNEGSYNGDWNPVWDLAVGRFEGGWVAEAAVPFKSLRFTTGASPLWGFNARRINRWKNEVSFLSSPPNGTGIGGIFRASSAATLVGIEPPRVRNLDVKPFAISDLTSNTLSIPRLNNKLGGDFGLDAKYGVTAGLTADLTYRTDFAQVEADEQQVNLTRFSLFFPEKREFFLENQGLFQFGGAAGNGNVPFAFYSRRIGLDRGTEVPIEGGGRLSGRVGDFGIGLINVQTEGTRTSPGTNFSVARVQRDILRRSSVGALFTRRSVSTLGPGSNELYGLDGRFAFYQNLTINTYYATTQTTGRAGQDGSYRVMAQYNGDRYGLTLHRVQVGKNFNPETGFVFRSDIAKYFTQARFSPRPRGSRVVRKYSFQGQIDYIENASAGYLETRDRRAQFEVEFQNSDNLEVIYTQLREGLVDPFQIATGVTVPVGTYDFGNLRTAFSLGQQRPISGTVFFEQGAFWDGDKTSFGFSGGRAKITPQLAVEPSLSVNRVTLPYGSFSTTLVSSRLTYTFTPLMFASGLIQYNSSSRSLSTNVRLRWEYRPGSELFVVYNEGRDTDRTGFPTLQNRSLIVKLNRLFRL
ncbi:MAG: DUF5916 domain-containing protein [Vicinamibacterales bacterium]